MESADVFFLEKSKEKSLEVLCDLEMPNGGYKAAESRKYAALWPRDCMYCAMAKEAVGDMASVKKTYDLIFEVFLQQRGILEEVIKTKEIPKHEWYFFPSKYQPRSLKPVKRWAHHQLDMIGLFMYKVADLKINKGIDLITNKERKELMGELFKYCLLVKCFEYGDNGIWEQWMELHTSSMGALLAAFRLMKNDNDFDYINISDEFINFGRKQMCNILPRESPPNYHPDYNANKEVDAAQLSLIWPFNIIDPVMQDIVLSNVENKLVREKGVIRFGNDGYFGNPNGEAQWTKFLGDLSIIYSKRRNKQKAWHYLEQMEDCFMPDKKGRLILPESYHLSKNSNVLLPNPHFPLAWSHANHIIAIVEYQKRFMN